MAQEKLIKLCADGKTMEVGLAHIADLAAITGGESPTEAEHNLVVTKVNAILARLEAAGISLTS